MSKIAALTAQFSRVLRTPAVAVNTASIFARFYAAKPAARLATSKRNQNQLVSVSAAIPAVKGLAKSKKFTESVDISVHLNVDPRKADQIVRGRAELPHGTGKKAVVAVFARDDKAKEALEAGATFVGAEDLVQKIQDGEVTFDRCIATPDMMPVVSRVARILGPRGLMPNPKMGTVTTDVGKLVAKEVAGSQVLFRVEKAGIIHAPVGRVDASDNALEENVRAFMKTLNTMRPKSIKDPYIKAVTLSTTMGSGSVMIDPTELRSS
uniref:Ribosomal protein n=1 Tax=Palpitomonas bilix TaxID=652834 RepID=A0A7S3G2C0_9EUKA